MRYRNKRKYIKIIIILSIFFIFVSSSYAYLSTRINITGVAKGSYSSGEYTIDPTGNSNLTIQNFSLTRWQENNLNKYQYKFKLKNIGTVNYDNYKITITFNSKIESVSIWNNSYSIDNNVLIISNETINLAPNGTVEISFIASSITAYLNIVKIKLESNTTTQEIDPSKFLVEFTKKKGWGNYTYQYDVKLTNKTGSIVNYWELNITLPEGTSYLSGWNAKFSTSENILIVKNETYNGRIENNKSTSFGLQLNTNIVNFIPNDIKIMIR